MNPRYLNRQELVPYDYGYIPNYTMPQSDSGIGASAASAAAGAASKSGLRGFFSKYFNPIGSGQPLFKGSINLPSLSAIREQQLYAGGPSIGGVARAGMGLYQGANAVKGLMNNINAEKDYNDIKGDINTAIASNPMYDTYLDASDEKALRQMRNGTLVNNWGDAAGGAVKGVPKALLTALLGGLSGGTGGALIGGLGSLANSAIEGYGRGTQEANSKLQGLYDKLRQADTDYRSMKRPRGLSRAGLSTQYYNQLY